MPRGNRPQIVAVIAWDGETNGPLVAAWRKAAVAARVLTPPDARRLLAVGDTALVRLDILPTLDGIEPGLDEIAVLEQLGIRVVNSRTSVLAAHDKWRTAALLDQAGVRQPRASRVATAAELERLALPFVVKPRFGSWGRDVLRCRTEVERKQCLALLDGRAWFRTRGAIAQELLPQPERDIRLLVANGEVVGAAARRPAPGEWRTNVSLGGSLEPTVPPAEACALGRAAVDAIGGDFMGVDILTAADGRYAVVEINAAPDFDDRYSLGGRNVYLEAAQALGLDPGYGRVRHAAGADRTSGPPKRSS